MLLEERLIYFPARSLFLTPDALGMAFEDALVETEDGKRIHGWFLPRSGSRFTVLFCHGNAGNVSHRLDRARLLLDRLPVDLFLFDYRGYGRSDGRPGEEGTYRDARAAHRYLTAKRGIATDRLVLCGESLGAAVAIQLALERPARALVLESAFASVAEMARLVLPLPGLGSLLRTRYDNLAKIPGIRVPLLSLHGERDSIVPLAQGRRLFDAAPEPKRFFAIPGADHNDTYAVGKDGYWRAWAEFLDAL
jgi:fermentation-respiration switch protein FrsA (DUF1100 family)